MQDSRTPHREPSGGNTGAATDTPGTTLLVHDTLILRGIAVLLIIARHTLGRAYFNNDSFLRPAYILVHLLSQSAVPLFLVLSGFSLSLGAGKNPRFRKYRHIALTRILPAYTLWYFTYAILTGVKHSDNLSVVSLASQFLLLANNGHLWFLVLLIQLYLLFPLLRRLYTHALFGRFTVLFVFAVVLVAQPLFESQAALAFAAPYCARLFSYFTVYFVLGFYLKDYASLFTRYARQPLVILSGLVFVCAMKSVEVTQIVSIPLDKYIADAGEIFGVINIFENTAIFVLLFVLSDWVHARCPRVEVFLSGYGLYSYGIYLAHVLPMALSYSVLRLFIHADNDTVILGNMIATMIVARLLVGWLNKLPFSKYYA